MRDIAFTATMLGLLPLAVARPFVGVLLWSWISFMNVLLWSWISFMNPHQVLWSFASAVPWAALVFCATVAGCVLAGEPRRFALNGVTASLVLLMLCFTVTSAAALGPSAAVWDKWLYVTKVLLGLLLTASLLTDRWRLHALVWMMVISVGYYGVKGGVFTIMTAGGSRILGPPGSMIGDNNHLAAAMLVTLPLMNYLRMHSRHAGVRWGFAAAMALSLLATVGSYSRGALIGLAAASLVIWTRSRHKVASAVVMGFCLAGAISFMPTQWVDRMNTISTYEEDASAGQRFEMWDTVIKLTLDRPMLGAGFAGTYSREVVNRVVPGATARAVHSIWLELLAEHGFPTFVVWCGLTVMGIVYSVRITRLARNRPELAWVRNLARMAQVSIVAYLVSGTLLSLSSWGFYWTPLVVLAAAHSLVVGSLQGDRSSLLPDRSWIPATVGVRTAFVGRPQSVSP